MDGPYPFMVDLSPPTVTSPLPNAQYGVTQGVTLDCSDVGSGISTCAASASGPTGQVIPFVYTFQFSMAHDTPQYQLVLNTRSLAPGPWTLKLTIGGETTIVYLISFTIEVIAISPRPQPGDVCLAPG